MNVLTVQQEDIALLVLMTPCMMDIFALEDLTALKAQGLHQLSAQLANTQKKKEQ